MKFIKHSNLEGKHALLGASKFHWIRYSDEKIATYYKKQIAKERGSKLHELASQCIKMNVQLPDDGKTLSMFVNDAIGFHMESEQILLYSENCFGTADAICFRNDILRIHDLKTGETDTHMDQLMIYAALFCLEYKIKPPEIQIILRIYQNNEIIELEPDSDEIIHIMDRIITADKIISSIKEQE
ncbi:MAG: DUF2800 domain-containing protein [Pseudobutyrivibrio sp.]|nr:DUF2800 domain-containing protein [Pseudobutyrivibrio sp.]